jgi:ABC-type sulfate/molybdate transport systems ATPase subunit
MVTYDSTAAMVADRVVFLGDGRIADVDEAPTIERILDHLRSPAR